MENYNEKGAESQSKIKFLNWYNLEKLWENNKAFRGVGKRIERWKTSIKGANLRIRNWSRLFEKIKLLSF